MPCAHAHAGRQHLPIEDNTLRFALIIASEASSLDLADLRAEGPDPLVDRKIDLVVGEPIRAAFKLRYPRGSRSAASPDPIIPGGLLRYFYRLARLGGPERWAAHLIGERLNRSRFRRDSGGWISHAAVG